MENVGLNQIVQLNDRQCIVYQDVLEPGQIYENISQANTLFNNAKFYYAAGEFNGALVSYSCCAVSLNWIIAILKKSSELNPQNQQILTCIKRAEDIQSCCLHSIEALKEKVKSNSAKGSKDDEELKDWEKICVKVQPLVFKKGTSDCIFFNDVIGLGKEKGIMKSSLIYPLMYPNLYPKASKGILIYGPPGTGKTYIVKAAVNELQKEDKNIGVLYFAPSPGDLKGKYVGETEKKIEELFVCASKAACDYQTKHCNTKKFISVIFMDEMDAIAPDRSTDTTGLAANSVNTLLQMMDGIKSAPNVAVVAATNYPWNLDGAILRRFDTQILVDLPEASDIKGLLDLSFRNSINLGKDRSDDTFCNDPYYNKKNDDKEQKVLCDLECEKKISPELYLEEPYNKLNIDYYTEKDMIGGIVDRLKADNFSNSDVNRLMKTALTHSGQVAVKNNLFYSTTLLNDYIHDRYISSLTTLKDVSRSISLSIKILKNIYQGSNIGTEYYQVSKPTIPYIEFGDYVYFSAKCLLHKNPNFLIDHPDITDYYIKTTTPAKLNDNSEPTAEESTTIFSITEYAKNVLGAKYISGTEPRLEYSGSDTIEYILSMPIAVKQVTNKSSNTPLLLGSKTIASTIFKPIEIKYQNIIIDYKNRKQKSEKDQSDQKDYSDNILDHFHFEPNEKTNFKNGDLFHFGNNLTLDNSLIKMIKEDQDTTTSIEQKVFSEFKTFDNHELDFYNMCLFFCKVNDANLNGANPVPDYIKQYAQSLFYPDIMVREIEYEYISNSSEYSLIDFFTDQKPEPFKIYYDKGSKNFCLTYRDYADLLQYFDIYMTLDYRGNRLFNPDIISTGYDEENEENDPTKWIVIPEDIFFIMFKNRQFNTNNPYLSKKINYDSTIKEDYYSTFLQQITQITIDDIFNLYKVDQYIDKPNANQTFKSELEKCISTQITLDESTNFINLVTTALNRIFLSYNKSLEGKPADNKTFIDYANKIGANIKSDVKNIVHKNIFIKSSVSIENLDIIIKKGGIFNLLKNTLLGTASLLKGFVGGEKGAAIERTKEQMKKANKLIEASNKQLLLPLLFKKIEAFGFLIRQPHKLAQNAQQIAENKQEEKKIIDDSKLQDHTSVKWLTADYKFSTTAANRFREALHFASGTSEGYRITSSIIGILLMLFVIFNGVVSAILYTALIAFINLYHLFTSTANKTEDVLTSEATISLFNTIKNGSIEVNTFEDDIFQAFIDEEQKMKSNSYIVCRKFMDFLSLTYQPIDNIVFTNTPSKIKIDNLKKEKDISDDATRNSMKNKLINLNVPLQSFYYALTLVKSTYVKQLGNDVKKYNEDKDAFMIEYAKRKK